MEVDRRLSVPEVAKILGVSERTVRRLITSQRIGVERIGSSVGIPSEELARFRAECFVPASPDPAPRRRPGRNLGELVDSAFQRTRRGSR